MESSFRVLVYKSKGPATTGPLETCGAKPKTGTDPIEAIGQAQSDRRLSNALVDHILSVEDYLLDTAINEYRAGKLTDHRLVGTIGGLEALRRLQERIQAQEQASIIEVERSTRSGGRSPGSG